MPDVFHPAFAGDCAAYAEPLRETASDPALIGYFLMNEPQWGFVDEPLLQGILSTGADSHTREVFARFLSERYADATALATAWQMPGLTFEAVARGPWRMRLTAAARPDLEVFSTVVVARFFDSLSAACRAVDPGHLNLGGRYYTSPPLWVQRGMSSFDVIGVNGYSQHVRRELEPFSRNTGKPVIVGEWHFGALDAGLPASGIGHVRDQTERGNAYRFGGGGGRLRGQSLWTRRHGQHLTPRGGEHAARMAGAPRDHTRRATVSPSWHPFRVRARRVAFRGYRSAQPPATLWHPFGMRRGGNWRWRPVDAYG